MIESCPMCDAEINDNTIDCPDCCYRIREAQLRKKLGIAEDAIVAWKAMNDVSRAAVAKLREKIENLEENPSFITNDEINTRLSNIEELLDKLVNPSLNKYKTPKNKRKKSNGW